MIILRAAQTAPKAPRKHKNVLRGHVEASQNIFKEFEFFTKMRFSKSRSRILFYFIKSSNRINRYIPRYPRMSWWTLRKCKIKRITKTIRGASELSNLSMAEGLVQSFIKNDVITKSKNDKNRNFNIF